MTKDGRPGQCQERVLAAVKKRRGRALTYIINVTAAVINNVSIITIDIDININNGAGTCTSHAGADVTSTTAPIPKESLSRDP